jgi:MYXO-CTERM domain-containing protein
MRTRLLPFALLLLLSAAAAGTARADGLPVLGVDLSRAGVAASDLMAPRYVSLPAGRDTLVAAVSQDGGQVRRSRLLDGRFTVPAVAYDGSPGGLSADGRTLVLINPRKGFPRRETTLAVLDTRRLRARDVIRLKGDFSFDAISPNGRLLYLVQYLSKRDPTRYLVRLYDLRIGRLLPEPIIDPREVGDVMRGTPVTRAASPDGRWAYTLYDGAGKHAFIHALDTTGRTARCIDLHGLTGLGLLFEMRLEPSPDGGILSVVHPAYERPHAVVDLQTWEVSEPEASDEPPPPASTSTPAEDEGGAPIALIAGAAAFVLVLLLVLLRRRRRPEPVEALGGPGDGAPPHPRPMDRQPGRRILRRQPRGGARRSRTDAKP